MVEEIMEDGRRAEVRKPPEEFSCKVREVRKVFFNHKEHKEHKEMDGDYALFEG